MALILGVVLGLVLFVVLVMWVAGATASGPDAQRATARAVRVKSPRALPPPRPRVAEMLGQAEADAGRTDARDRGRGGQAPGRDAPRTRRGDRAPADRHRYRKPDNVPVSLGRNGGPPWMDPSEWAEKVAIYRGQGRSEANICEVAEYLARRG